MATPAEFYDALAGEYHLLFDDWWAAARWHGGVVAGILAGRGVSGGRLLDCTCGVGTQALPLATLGYDVTGTDVSGAAVDRARAEAAARDLDVDLRTSDVREVRQHVDGRFDAVVSCDNALPHLLADQDLERALRNAHDCLRAGGVLLVSIRDYDALKEARPAGVPVRVHGDPGSRHGSGQAWCWSADGEYVDIELFTFTEDGIGSWRARSVATRSRALERATVTRFLASAGFSGVEWLMPEDSGYYQPVVVATG